MPIYYKGKILANANVNLVGASGTVVLKEKGLHDVAKYANASVEVVPKLIFTSQIGGIQDFGIPNMKRDTVYLIIISDEDDFSFNEYPDPNCCVIYTYSFTGDDFARATFRDGGVASIDVINDELYITDKQYQGYIYMYEL